MNVLKTRLLGTCAILLAGAIGIGFGPTPARADDTVTQQMLQSADQNANNWITHHKDYSAHRFSTLDQINAGNVKDLKVAWTLQLGGIEGGGIWSHGGLEGTPLVEDGFMYVTDGWGSVYKIDTHGGEGKLVWKMNPKTDHDWAGAVACCGVDNRGVALWDGMVVSHTLDGRLIVTDKKTGQIAWQRQVANPDKGEVVTGAPLIVKNLAITGVAGAEYGIRGWLAATDLNTHKEVWRTYTIPAKGEPNYDTWKSKGYDSAINGGGSTWVTGSYDPATNTLYWGTANPGPDWDNQYRPGDNLYTDSTLALDADTGKIKWHFQHTPNDDYDYDSVAENVLVDVPGQNGAVQKLDLEADRNGIGYAVDRDTGKFVWALPFVKKLTWTKGVDPETGKPAEYDPKKDVQTYAVAPSRDNKVVEICPGNMGGKNWPPTAYNPNLHLWYIPVIESCNRVTEANTIPGKSYKPREFFTGGGPSENVRITGSVTAIDVTTGKEAGKFETKYPMLGGILATPDLVFAGEPDGHVFALNAKTLQKLWSFDTGGGVSAPPMTFAVDGKQYVAILVGQGGAWDKWFIEATPELKKIAPSSVLYVFAL